MGTRTTAHNRGYGKPVLRFAGVLGFTPHRAPLANGHHGDHHPIPSGRSRPHRPVYQEFSVHLEELQRGNSGVGVDN